MEKEFGFLRSLFWPVHSKELPKFIPLLLLCFLISLNYYLLRSVKDALIINSSKLGAAIIPSLYIWGLLPGAFLFTMVFTKLSNRYCKIKVFYLMCAIFFCFFALFITLLYPYRNALRPSALSSFLCFWLPTGFASFIAMIENWIEVSFYIMAELWGTTIFYVGFWGFVNEKMAIHEAARFYALFGLVANLSGIAAGKLSMAISAFCQKGGLSNWSQTLFLTCLLFLAVSAAIIGILWWLSQPKIAGETVAPLVTAKKEPQEKMTLFSPFRYVTTSQPLLLMATSLLIYYATTNLTDVVWKNTVHEWLSDPVDYNGYMGKITYYTSIISILSALFMTGNTIRRLGWLAAALITPIVLLITTLGFFSTLFFTNICLMPLQLSSALRVAVFCGSVQNILCRVAKYTLFDPTKELLFIPLDPASKNKAKAAIDGVGARLGKALGSIFFQLLFFFTPNFKIATFYIAALVVIASLFWIYLTCKLGAHFKKMASEVKRGSIKKA